MEAIFAVQSLVEGVVPPTLNLAQPDPSLLGQALVAKNRRGLRPQPKSVMSNSFGFGGTNASLLFAASPQ